VQQDLDAGKSELRRSACKPPPPIEDLLGLSLILAPFPGVVQAEQYAGLTAENSSQDKLCRATQTMRGEMNESVNVERRTQHVVEMVFRVSGRVPSVAFARWDPLVSALSLILTWKGFDPLPVLAQKPKVRFWKSKDPQIPEITLDKDEEAAGRILNSINNGNATD
jgi:hypothetical protein